MSGDWKDETYNFILDLAMAQGTGKEPMANPILLVFFNLMDRMNFVDRRLEFYKNKIKKKKKSRQEKGGENSMKCYTTVNVFIWTS